MNKIFSYTFIGLIISFLFYRCFLKEEINCGLRDTLDQRHELIDSLYNQIDSLYKEIDTLQYEKEIFDFGNVSENEIISALMYVESSNNDSAYNANEDAVGCLQIRKTMVNDVNRILTTSLFTFNGKTCSIRNVLNSNKLQIVDNEGTTQIDNIGSYDASVGTVSLVGFNPTALQGQTLQVSVVPANQSTIRPLRNFILDIDNVKSIPIAQLDFQNTLVTL